MIKEIHMNCRYGMLAAVLQLLGLTAWTAASTVQAEDAPGNSQPIAVSLSADKSCTVTAYAPQINDDRISISSSVSCTEQVSLLQVSTFLMYHVDGEDRPFPDYTGATENFSDVTTVPLLTYSSSMFCDPGAEGGIAPFRTYARILVTYADGSYGEAEVYSDFVNLDCTRESGERRRR
jgi:hypothetical protein